MNDQVSKAETAKILGLAEKSLSAPGDFVELGCYRGTTSVLLGHILEQYNKDVNSATSNTSARHSNAETIGASEVLKEHPEAKFVQSSKSSVVSVSSLRIFDAPSRSLPGAGDTSKVFEKLKDTTDTSNDCNIVASGRFSKSLGVSQGSSSGRSLRTSTVSQSSTSGCCSKTLYLYDSFSGLPEKSSLDASGEGAAFRAGELAVTKREVFDKLKRAGLHHFRIKKAWFSDLTPDDLPAEIAFAFIDGDFYESQRAGLNLVAPKLSRQGIIICHDYNNPALPGASRAVDEFLRAHPDFYLQQLHTLAILCKR